VRASVKSSSILTENWAGLSENCSGVGIKILNYRQIQSDSIANDHMLQKFVVLDRKALLVTRDYLKNVSTDSGYVFGIKIPLFNELPQNSRRVELKIVRILRIVIGDSMLCVERLMKFRVNQSPSSH
jgi:hypothetical protein